MPFLLRDREAQGVVDSRSARFGEFGVKALGLIELTVFRSRSLSLKAGGAAVLSDCDRSSAAAIVEFVTTTAGCF